MNIKPHKPPAKKTPKPLKFCVVAFGLFINYQETKPPNNRPNHLSCTPTYIDPKKKKKKSCRDKAGKKVVVSSSREY